VAYASFTDFHFPKMHMLSHWEKDIHTFGTYDNTNTEGTERMHIEFAKDAFKASNRREYIAQMCSWLQRRQSVHLFATYLSIRTGMPYEPRRRPIRKKALRPINLTVEPQRKGVAIGALAAEHKIPNVTSVLRRYLQTWHGCSGPTWALPLPVHVEQALLSLRGVDIFYRVRFKTPDLQTFWAPDVFDVATAYPARKSRQKNEICARFDTVLVETKGNGVAGLGGLEGMSRCFPRSSSPTRSYSSSHLHRRARG